MSTPTPLTCAPAPARPVPGGHTAPRCCLLMVWPTGPAGFAARAVLPDGTMHDFSSPFELARFLSAPVPPPPTTAAVSAGLR